MSELKKAIMTDWVFNKVKMVKSHGHMIGTYAGAVKFEYHGYRIQAVATSHGLVVSKLTTPGETIYLINEKKHSVLAM